MWVRVLIGCFAFVFAVLWSLPAQCETVRIEGASILVGDLVPRCKGAACNVEVGPAPAPGISRVVERTEVERALDQSGVSAAKIKIPMRLRVLRTSRAVEAEELAQKIRTALKSVLPQGIVLDKLSRMRSVKVPTSGFDVAVEWHRDSAFRSRQSFPVTLSAEGVVFRTLRISATFNLELRLPVAARDIKPGEVIDGNAVTWQLKQLDNQRIKYATSLSEVVGQQAQQAYREGEPFAVSGLERIPVVLRGQRVTVESRVGSIRIHTSGVARQDGAVGDRIRVTVRAVERLVWAQVTAPGMASVVQ